MQRALLQPLLVFIGVILPFSLLSQTYDFHYITTVDGLPHNEVRKIVKDTYGYLWLGTQNGLSRYDGNNFENYKASNVNAAYRICGDKIYALAASSDKIWAGTTKGLSVIHSKTGVILDKELPEEDFSNLKTVFINCIYSDSKDVIWVASGAGNYMIESSNYSLTQILKGYNVLSFKEISNGNMWIGTNKGIVLYNVESHQIISVYPKLKRVENFFTDKFGVLWTASSAGVHRFVPEKNKFVQMFATHATNAVAEAKNGDMVFTSYGNGLLVYSRISGTFNQFKSDPKNQKSLSSNDLYDIIVDDEGIIWVGSQEGLDVCDWTRSRFKALIHDPDNSNSLSSNFVQAIYKDKSDAFWFGTRSNGVDKVVFENGDYTNPIFENIASNIYEDNALWGSSITSVFQDHKDRIWMTSMGKGLNLYDKKNNTFRHFEHNRDTSQSLASNNATSIIQDHKKRFWVSTTGGLSLMEEDDQGNMSFKNFYHDKYDKKSISLNSIFKVFQDSKNRIWLAINHGGVSLVHEEDNGDIWFENFRRDHKDAVNTLSSEEVFIVFEDSKNRVWFGTSSGGLNLLIEKPSDTLGNINYSFKHYTENDGLSDNEVNSLLEDGAGKLWVATNKGFSHFDPETEVFVNYTTYDGVLKGKFRKNSAYKNQDGTMFFGGAAGVNYFNPDEFKSNTIEPNPQFKALFLDDNRIEIGEEINGKPILNEALSSGATISLPGDYNRFEIHFTAVSFASSMRNKYSYKLEGYDTDWKKTTSNELKANYFNLPGGEYKFLLKASNNDGLWSSEPIYLNVVVESTFFDALAKHKEVLLIICAAVILLIVFKYRKTIKAPIESQKRSEKEKVLALSVSEEDEELVNKLKAVMEIDKLHLNPLLSLQTLASELDVTSNQLSRILNDCMQTNFYDFINSYRVAEVKRRLADPQYKSQTLLSISGDCGFNSKSAFNRIFKNVTGKTPSQFQKSLKNE